MTRHPKTDLAKTVRNTLAAHAMCLPGDHLLVALSGGADSMALLHSLHRLAPELGLTLSVAHLNHGIRGEAAHRDQIFSEETADSLSIPFYTETVDVPALARREGRGIEDAARQARHAFLQRIAECCKARRIAVGHHKGDMAEQLLLNLLRGAGLKGLGAMEPVTENGVIRPLMDLTREEIAAWLKAEGIPHVTDESNTDTAYTRNRVRHRLIPLLEEAFNPSAVDTLARTAALLREEEAWMAEITEGLAADCLISEEPHRLVLSTRKLGDLHPAARKRVLRHSVSTLCGSTRTLTTAHIQSLTALLDQGGGGRSVDLTRGLRGVLTRGQLHLLVETESLRKTRPKILAETPAFSYQVERTALASPFTLTIEETGDRLSFQWAQAPTTPGTSRNAARVFVNPDTVSFPLTVRNARPGDRFRPEGGSGTRKLGRFLADCHVEGPKRSRIPLVTCGETILWVAGHRLHEAATAPSPGGPVLEMVHHRGEKG